MAIELTAPVIVPASEEKVFNEIWIRDFHVIGNNPNAPVRLYARVSPARTLPDGITKELSSQTIKYSIEDLYKLASQDQEIATLIYSLINKIKLLANL
jgi:hypothetical protein